MQNQTATRLEVKGLPGEPKPLPEFGIHWGAIDELAYQASRLHALLVMIEDSMEEIDDAVSETSARDGFRRIRSVMAMASELAQPMDEHIDALPRCPAPKIPESPKGATLPGAKARPADLPQTQKLRSYLSDVQAEVVQLEALVEGVEILMQGNQGSNACGAMITLALKKARWANLALDSMNLPEVAE